jgi:hypothetical protein
MTCDYNEITKENEIRYGTDIGRIGRQLFSECYDDKTHFIFELLQNAEDAIARREGWQGSRTVSFHLTKTDLRIGHFGQPFDENDVRGICGIAESTKGVSEIGRFGIGFKSVYAFTDRPEIHSGTENFSIKNYVWPSAISAIDHEAEETVILLPLKSGEESGHCEIADGLENIGASALLFLREIDEICWSVEGGCEGRYLREEQDIDENVRLIKVIGQEQDEARISEEWLVFSRPVRTEDGHKAGNVEIGFSIFQEDNTESQKIHCLDHSPLVVYFPTVVETHLGFLVQGPYRTTPNRDNVLKNDSWNQSLVTETASLLVETLLWLRDHGWLDSEALQCLPLAAEKFDEFNRFAPMFEEIKDALCSERLLPCFDTGHVSSPSALIGRTAELRALFTSLQLSSLYDKPDPVTWLSGDISRSRTPELYRYLTTELDIEEVGPQAMIWRLDKSFLEDQPDDWILHLYMFLNAQPALQSQFSFNPLIRLEDGSHVKAEEGGRPQAFLPGSSVTEFPTVRANVCSNDSALSFLHSLGLTEPDPVDEVIMNLLPRFVDEEAGIADDDYADAIHIILKAFQVDSMNEHKKLIKALRTAHFVMAVDAANGAKVMAKPEEVYLATQDLKELFGGVDGVYLVDDSYACLQGKECRGMLDACGASRFLRQQEVIRSKTILELKEIRREAGQEQATSSEVVNHTLDGLSGLMEMMVGLDQETRTKKALLLWKALGELARGNQGVFNGKHKWKYVRKSYSAEFPASFVDMLNEKPWIPAQDGTFQTPSNVLFEETGWEPNPFLESKIRFQPPVLEQLAQEAGIDKDLIVLMQEIGMTAAELRKKLGIDNKPAEEVVRNRDAGDTPIKNIPGDTPESTSAVSDQVGLETVKTDDDGAGATHGVNSGSSSEKKRGESSGENRAQVAGQASAKRPPGSVGGRPFISYVAARPDDEEPDPDGLDQEKRLALEARAIDFILSCEPEWKRTLPNNPGFDLFQVDDKNREVRWCEVKAMTGSLHDRPVGLSHTQFKLAQKHGESFWLYVVEYARTDPRIVRIQDPAGKARTFTFDHGWIDVAELDSELDSDLAE